MENDNLNPFQKLAAKAADLLRAWAYDHPLEDAPDSVVEAIATSCVPEKDKDVRTVADCVGYELDDPYVPDNTGVPVDVLRFRIYHLLEEYLEHEWYVIDGEREVMNEFEDDLD
jgi:hypothetical protein